MTEFIRSISILNLVNLILKLSNNNLIVSWPFLCAVVNIIFLFVFSILYRNADLTVVRVSALIGRLILSKILMSFAIDTLHLFIFTAVNAALA